jgi:plasmid stability protein
MATMRTRSGTKLTKKVIEALADEAERGYDLTKAKRVAFGRPSLGDVGVSPRVQVRVDPELAEALKARANKEHRSVSEIARTALREYVDRTEVEQSHALLPLSKRRRGTQPGVDVADGAHLRDLMDAG